VTTSTTLVLLTAETISGGNVRYTLCAADGTTCDTAHPFDSAPGAEHFFAFEVDGAKTSLSVDCAAVATLPGTPLASDRSVTVQFGARDGEPIDGTIDDVVISFK
jgi:hypothetical protein